jgi:hypothetical protein
MSSGTGEGDVAELGHVGELIKSYRISDYT